MSVEINMVGKTCGAEAGGLSCLYCYQHGTRAVMEPPPPLDMEAVKAAIEASGCTDFSLFGGEALLAPLHELETVWTWGLARYGKNGVQTSGRPITDQHLELFRRFKVHVGFSIDGPGELNDARRAGSIAKTREATAHSEAMLRRILTEPGYAGASLIITLNATNVRGGRLPRLVAWVKELMSLGLASVRLHTLEHDGPAASGYLALDHEENLVAIDAFREAGIRSDVEHDIRSLLTAQDHDVTCVFNGCDPITTDAVHGVGRDGSRYGCDRAMKDAEWVPAARGVNFRPLTLAVTPQEDGGCKDCRFFVACKGQCPGTAIDGDWRMRSRDCPLWFKLFEREEARLEAEGKTPISKDPRLPTVLANMMAAWERGDRPSIATCLGEPGPAGQDRDGHADRPHIDWHEDHTDAGRPHHTDGRKE